MTLHELQEYCLANAVDAIISGDNMTVSIESPRYYQSETNPPIVFASGYLDEPVSWLMPDEPAY